MKLTQKTVLITGASRGIGREIAKKFAEAKAQVAIHYRNNETAAEETLAMLSGEGHFTVQANIADPDEVQQMVNTVIKRLGKLDILVNNAGVYEDHPIADVDYETWQASWHRVIQTNLVGAGNMCYCVARHMIEQGSGRIINVGSRGAFRGEPTGPAYGASKAGLHALSQSLAKYLGQYNISVMAVAPGFVSTDMAAPRLAGPDGDDIRNQSPFKRVAKPEEVAHTVLFLATPEAAFLSGAVVDVNGASYLR